jgi:hypothetical protein
VFTQEKRDLAKTRGLETGFGRQSPEPELFWGRILNQ